MKKIRFCQDCDRYTLKTVCVTCGKDTIVNVPQRYSNDEEVAKYRRIIKKETLSKTQTG